MIRRSEAIALLECMAQNALGAFASTNGQEKESAAQHYKALDVAIAELKRAEGDPGPFVRPDNLSENEFLIVERHCVEVYSKGEYLPTPMPKDCVAIPMAMNTQKAIAVLAEELKVANKILKQRDLEPGVAEIGRDKIAAFEAGIHALSTMQKEENEETVYCKDCMYMRRSYDKSRLFCGIHPNILSPFEMFENDFCSRGIRRGGTS